MLVSEDKQLGPGISVEDSSSSSHIIVFSSSTLVVVSLDHELFKRIIQDTGL